MSTDSEPSLVADGCIFCKIVTHQSDTSLKYEDENFVAFDDIAPASSFHLLIVPKKHVKDAKSLTRNDVSTVETMKEIAVNLARESKIDLNDIRLGFHWPPFTTIKHLHLHVISPVSTMSYLKRIMFKPGSWWFIDVDTFLEQLKSAV